MVFAKLTYDKNWIILESDSGFDIDRIRQAFTLKINDWFILKKKNPLINVDEAFINEYNMIPVGLWLELIATCQRLNISLQFSDDFNTSIKDCSLNREDFDKYVADLFKNPDLQPKDYQKDSVFNILQYKKCCVEISTSGGKTFISYILFRYMIDVLGIKHILFITPKTNLTTQSGEKFIQYDEQNGIESDWTYSEIHSKAKKKKEYNDTIIFGNYQSLCKKKQEFFDQFEAVIEDECVAPDTLIIMADGTKRKISEIKEGDVVYTFNEKTKKKEQHAVEYVYHNLSIKEKLYEIELENGNKIQITGNHKVLLKNGIYKRVDELTLEDEIQEF